MGFFRFRRSFKVFPGLKLNLSKTGVSTSIGRRGAWFTIGPRGTRTTLGLPGTGLSYTETHRPDSGGGMSHAAPIGLAISDGQAPPPDLAAQLEAENPGGGAHVFLVLAILALVAIVAFGLFA